MSLRWVPRVKELMQLILSGQRTFSSPVSEKVKTILGTYHTKLEESFRSTTSPQKSRVFANNYLNLGDIDAIGFDLDYTLVPYTVELQNLIFTLARDTLVSAYDYPNELKTCFFDPEFAIRGLSVDTRSGVLTKLNYLHRVRRRYSYKGTRQISSEEMMDLYGTSRHINVDDYSIMRPMNDLFSMAEACLIADTVEVFEHRKKTKGEQYSSNAIIDDVKTAISHVHISGLMQNAIMKDFERFVKYNPNLMDLLFHFKKADKKLFLASNSAYHYVDKAMSYAMGLPSDQVPSPLKTNDWKELFDIVICSAQKPDFFASKKPFRAWNIQYNRPLPTPVHELKPSEIYVQGSAHAIQNSSAFWKNAEVLYVGDNLGADLIEAKKRHGWHTGLIINELDREIEIQSSLLFSELHFLRSTLRNVMTDIQLAMFSTREIKNTITYPVEGPAVQEEKKKAEEIATGEKTLPMTSDGEPSLQEELMKDLSQELPPEQQRQQQQQQQQQQKIAEYAQHISHFSNVSYEENHELLSLLENELQSINTELSLLFNPQFGSMFRTDGHPSLYAYHIRRYADIYMSEVSHFLHYSPSHRFYPPHALHMVSESDETIFYFDPLTYSLVFFSFFSTGT
jgi:HAD superfamily 5'-nucleotidase-like hydrolase